MITWKDLETEIYTWFPVECGTEKFISHIQEIKLPANTIEMMSVFTLIESWIALMLGMNQW